MNEKGSFSPLQVGAIVLVFWVVAVLAQWRPGDFEVPPQAQRHAEKIVSYCRIPLWDAGWSGCYAVLPNGTVAKVSYRRALVGPMVIVHSKSGEETKNIPLGKFLREGGHFLFDPRNYP